MATASNQFFIFLPSHTAGYEHNQPNRYRTRLPRTLEFSGNWVVGLHSISYSYSWDNLGTLDSQWMQLHLKNGQIIRIPIPNASFSSAENIANNLMVKIKAELELHFKEREKQLQILLGSSNASRRKRNPAEFRPSSSSPPPFKQQTKELVEPERAPSPVEPEQVPTAAEEEEELLRQEKEEKELKKVASKTAKSVEVQKPLTQTPAPTTTTTTKATTKQVPEKPKPVEVAQTPLTSTPAPATATIATTTKQVPEKPKPVEVDQKSLTPTPVPATTTTTTKAVTKQVLEKTNPKPAQSPTPTPTPTSTSTPTRTTPAPQTKPVNNKLDVEKEKPKPVVIQKPTPPNSIKSNEIAGYKFNEENAVEPERAPSPVEPEHVPTAAEEEQMLETYEEPSTLEKLLINMAPIPTKIYKTVAPIILPTPTYLPNPEYVRENAYFPSNLSNNDIRKLVEAIEFQYVGEQNKFKIVYTHPHILHISLSSQIAYLLGFEDSEQQIYTDEIAKYTVDLKGGIDSFGVYAKGLTENIICGSELVSLLRVVTIAGSPKFGDRVEQIYSTPIYLKVLPKKISEIEIELRSMHGDARLMPFQYGTTMIVLVFKKVINF